MRVEIQTKSGHLSWAKREQTSTVIDISMLFNDYWASKAQELTVPGQCDLQPVRFTLTVAEVVSIGRHSYSLKLQFSANATVRLFATAHRSHLINLE